MERSDTSWRVFGDTRCQMGSRWERMMASKERNKAESMLRSSISSCTPIASEDPERPKAWSADRGVAPLDLAQGGLHAFEDGGLDLVHRRAERLMQLHDVGLFARQVPLDVGLEAVEAASPRPIDDADRLTHRG